MISLSPTVGAEMRKTRPAVIVNDNDLGRLPLKIVVPITDWKERYAIAPRMIKLIPDSQNKLKKASAADCFQVRSLSEQRFVKKVGHIDGQSMKAIQSAIALVLSID